MTNDDHVTPALLVAFLNGEGPLDGRWFGDNGPLRQGGRFWWRKHLAVLLRPWQPIATAPQDGSVFITWTPPQPPGWPHPTIDMCEWSEEHGIFIKHGCGFDDVTHWRPMLGGPDAPESRTIPGQPTAAQAKAQ